jgi:uncharacterized protein (DUF2344 family)
MKTQKQIKEKIQEIESIIDEAETTGKSKQINTFSELRKYKTRLYALAWVLDETRKSMGGKE